MMSVEELIKELKNSNENLKEIISDKKNDCNPQIIANYMRMFQKEKNFYRMLAFLMFLVGFVAGLVFG